MMATQGRYTLSWNDQERSSVMLDGITEVSRSNNFSDVTLLTEDGQNHLVHRFILSACSNFFNEIFTKSNNQNMHVLLAGISEENLKAILDFIYTGQAEVAVKQLEDFTGAANILKIKGLYNDNDPGITVQTPAVKVQKNKENLNNSELEEMTYEEFTLEIQPEDANADSVPTKSIQCNICDSEFQTKKGLRLHQTKLHMTGKTKTVSINPEEKTYSEWLRCPPSRNQEQLQENCLDETAGNLELPDSHLNQQNQADKTIEIKVQKTTVENEELPKVSGDVGNSCLLCGSTFSGRRANKDLVKHSIEIHGERKPYKCRLCFYKSNIRHNLVLHSNHIHANKQSVCA